MMPHYKQNSIELIKNFYKHALEHCHWSMTEKVLRAGREALLEYHKEQEEKMAEIKE